MKKLGLLTAIAGTVLASFIGCSSPGTATRENTVFTGIAPHRYFAQRIAGTRFRVESLIGPGADAHTFTPLPAQITALSRSRAYFKAGIEFEAGVLPDITAANPGLLVVDLHSGIAERPFDGHGDEDGHGHHDGDGHAHKAERHEEHAHETEDNDGHHHHHGGQDPHAWMAPQTAKKQAVRIRDAFKRLDPDNAAQYDSAFAVLGTELDSLDAELKTMLHGLEGRELFVFHPAFGYFADAYGLEQVAVETGGKEPGARALARLIDEVKEKNVRTLFVQPQYPAHSVQAVAQQTGCAVVPVSSMPVDYFKEMRELGRAVAQGLKNGK